MRIYYSELKNYGKINLTNSRILLDLLHEHKHVHRRSRMGDLPRHMRYIYDTQVITADLLPKIIDIYNTLNLKPKS